MRIKRFLIEFVTAFAVVFVVNAIVVYLWNIFRHGEGAFNWGITLVFSIACGITLALVHSWKGNK